MKRLLLLLILTGLTFGQTVTGQYVSVQGRWPKDFKEQYQIVQYSLRAENGDTTMMNMTLNQADVTVIDTSAAGAQFQWLYHDFVLVRGDTSLLKAYRLGDSTSIRYKTDDEGRFWEMTNHNALRMEMDKRINTYTATHSITPNEKEYLAQLKDITESQAAFEGDAINEIHLFHFPFGLKLHTDSIFVGAGQIPGGAKGKMLATTIEKSVIEVDSITHRAVVQVKVTADPNDLREAILAQMGAGYGIEGDDVAQEKLQNAQMVVLYEADVNLNNGTIEYAFMKKNVEVNGESYLEVLYLNNRNR